VTRQPALGAVAATALLVARGRVARWAQLPQEPRGLGRLQTGQTRRFRGRARILQETRRESSCCGTARPPPSDVIRDEGRGLANRVPGEEVPRLGCGAAALRRRVRQGVVDTGAGGNSTAGKPSGGATIEPLPTSGRAAVQTGGAPSVTMNEPPVCVPSAEECNARDDDCNGAVDDLPAEACPGGGFRFCVAGRLSECPRRCDVCVPGSGRVCQNSFCSFWGEQECAADGQGFGNCREAEPPPECATTAKKFENSKELEQCCLDNGYCCLDQHDLDGDGDRREMLGACGDIACQ
jgi:hypothetical protein